EPEARLLRALSRDADFPVFRDIGDAGILQRFLHRLADLRPRAAQEALAVRQALALGIEAPVDEVGHETIRGRPTPPCSPACTIQRDAVPGAVCSHAPACA